MKGQSTREYIIEKAAALFNTHGYNGCSLNDIMDATGLKKGGIYNHFKNKDAIALEAFEYSFKKIFEKFRNKLDNSKGAKEKLFSIIDTYMELFHDPIMEGGCPIFNTAVDANNTHPELRKKAQQAINSLKKYIEIKINQGMSSKEFKPNCNPDEISSMFIINMEGAIIYSLVNDDVKYLSQTSKRIKEYILNDMLISN